MEYEVEDPLQWRREIIRSSINKFRSYLSSQPYFPGRILQAFGGIAGYIQWITLTFALWGFILLAMLRIPWAKIQIKLIQKGYLPWDKYVEKGIWDLSESWPTEKSYSAKLSSLYPGMFVANRLIEEVVREKEQNIPIDITAVKPQIPSTAELIRQRITEYQNDVSNEYGIINYILSIIPILGFLGTILGLILTMSNISELLTAVNNLDKIEVLKKLGSYLGSAFDTSFFALFL